MVWHRQRSRYVALGAGGERQDGAADARAHRHAATKAATLSWPIHDALLRQGRQLGDDGYLARHRLADGRAIAEGLSIDQGARHSLAIEHGAEALGAHRLVVERVAALARRRGDRHWRLLARVIVDPPVMQLWSQRDVWAESEELTSWSMTELHAIDVEQCGAAATSVGQRVARNARLRVRRLVLLRDLEDAVAFAAVESDRLDGWLASELAEQLCRLCLPKLADLRERIRVGSRRQTGADPIVRQVNA